MPNQRDYAMFLTIDTGNSRTKWGVFDHHGLISQGVFSNTTLLDGEMPSVASLAWQICKHAVISNVAGAHMAEAITNILQSFNLPCCFITAEWQACDVINHYSEPKQLGSDRWAALIAAWQCYHAPCVVANAGTALTIDALNAESGHGVFLGGTIMPGFRLMQSSLLQNTSEIHLSEHLTDPSVQDFPINTQDAVYTGALNAMTSAVETMLFRMQQHTGTMPICVVSGGDAARLAKALNQKKSMGYRLEVVDSLVLIGLHYLAQAFTEQN